jgi:hypothetical protein
VPETVPVVAFKAKPAGKAGAPAYVVTDPVTEGEIEKAVPAVA